MNQANKHVATLFTSLAVTFSKLGHCPMASLIWQNTRTCQSQNLVNKILNAQSRYYDLKTIAMCVFNKPLSMRNKSIEIYAKKRKQNCL